MGAERPGRERMVAKGGRVGGEGGRGGRGHALYSNRCRRILFIKHTDVKPTAE